MRRRFRSAVLSISLVLCMVFGTTIYAADPAIIQVINEQKTNDRTNDEHITNVQFTNEQETYVQPTDEQITYVQPTDEQETYVQPTDEQITYVQSTNDHTTGTASVTNPYVEGVKGNTANLVVFVEFSDTEHKHENSYMGLNTCYLDDPMLDQLFLSESNSRSLRRYLSEITNGQLLVASMFPQYDPDTGKITPYKLNGTNDYYYEHQETMINEICRILDNEPLLTSADLDRNEDGILDNLMIITANNDGNYSTTFSGVYVGSAGPYSVKGKKVVAYDLMSESEVYFGIQESAVIVHEYMHSQGFPDLYRNSDSGRSFNPVGTWDIMSSVSLWLQFPLAYFRSELSTNTFKSVDKFTIPEVTTNTTGYSLYSASAAKGEGVSDEIKDNQAVILKTGYSDTEFFVIEYRRSEGNIYSKTTLDDKIPGNGLVIYRINNAVKEKSNRKVENGSDPFYCYVFRPGDSYGTGCENAQGNINASFLSAESGRTSYGSPYFMDGISEGAITYSDGTNSGIVISNVGNTETGKITFDISFTDFSGELLWQTEATNNSASYYASSSIMDDNGNIYVLGKSGSSANIMKLTGGQLQAVAANSSGYEYKIAEFKGKLYLIYNEQNTGNTKVARLDGSTWTDIFTANKYNWSGDIAIEATDSYLYWSYIEKNSDGYYADCFWKVYRYDGTNTTSLGTIVTQSGLAVPVLAVNEDHVVAGCRNSYTAYLYEYKNNAWKCLTNNTKAAQMNAYLDGDKVYMTACQFEGNDPYASGIEMPLRAFVMDLSEDNPKWQQAGGDIIKYGTLGSGSMAFYNGQPYLFCTDGDSETGRMYTLENGKWIGIGNTFTGCDNFTLHAYLGKYYTTYVYNYTIYVKSLSGVLRDESSPYYSIVKQASLTLDGSIGVNIYAEASKELKSDPDAYAVLEIENNPARRISIKLTDALQMDGNYKLTMPLYTREASDNVILEVYTGRGDKALLYQNNRTRLLYNDQFVYSVSQYTEQARKEAADNKLVALCESIDDFRIYTQRFFEYNEGDEEPGSVSDVTAEQLKEYNSTLKGTKPDGISIDNVSLVLKSKTSIVVYISTKVADTINKYTVTVDGQPVSCEKLSSTSYRVIVSDIPASELGKTHVFEITDGTKTQSLEYSALSYAEKALKYYDSSEELKDVCRALYNYYKAAKAYFVE